MVAAQRRRRRRSRRGAGSGVAAAAARAARLSARASAAAAAAAAAAASAAAIAACFRLTAAAPCWPPASAPAFSDGRDGRTLSGRPAALLAPHKRGLPRGLECVLKRGLLDLSRAPCCCSRPSPSCSRRTKLERHHADDDNNGEARSCSPRACRAIRPDVVQALLRGPLLRRSEVEVHRGSGT